MPETREIARSVAGWFRRLSRAVERQRLRRVDEALAPIKRYGFRRVRDRLREARQRWGEGVESLAPSVRARSDDARLRLASAREWLPDGPQPAAEDRRRGARARRAAHAGKRASGVRYTHVEHSGREPLRSSTGLCRRDWLRRRGHAEPSWSRPGPRGPDSPGRSEAR